jgi:hypothetical protein
MKYRHLFIFLFLYLWLMLGFRLSVLESPTFDEPVHLRAAILYEKGDYDFDPVEPPLLRRAVYFLGRMIEKISGPSLTLFPYRAVVVVLTGLALCLLLWPLFSRSAFAGLLASVLIVYEPNLVAHSHYFTTDALSAIISVIAALLVLSGFWQTKKQFFILLSIIALAASLKVATLSLLGPLLLIKSPKLGIKRLALLFVFCFISIWATYGFRAQVVGNFSDINFPLGGYIRSLKENLLFAKRGQPIFFNEVLYQKSPWFKTPVVLFAKTSLPLLLLSAWGLRSGRKRRNLVILLVISIAVGIFKPLNFGMRHLLPTQLALVFLAAKVRPKSILNWMVFTLLIIWHMFSFWSVMPQPLTFANELVRNPAQVFSDSDFDWGQGLVELRGETSRLGLSDFQLAYFGNNNPANYLSDFRLVTDIGEIDYRQPAIISVTCYYQCGYYRDPYFSRAPKRLIAKSFFLFL